jgi:hypothetical protein
LLFSNAVVMKLGKERVWKREVTREVTVALFSRSGCVCLCACVRVNARVCFVCVCVRARVTGTPET